jgi:hypothetical protein
VKDDGNANLPYDKQFADCARRAAPAFGKIAQALQTASETGVTRELVEALRSGRGIGPGECAVLADLISGELCRAAGRPTKKAQDHERHRAILSRCRELMDQYRAQGRSRGSRPEVIKQVASEYYPLTQDQVAAIWKGASGKSGANTITRAQYDELMKNDDSARLMATRIREGGVKLVD